VSSPQVISKSFTISLKLTQKSFSVKGFFVSSPIFLIISGNLSIYFSISVLFFTLSTLACKSSISSYIILFLSSARGNTSGLIIQSIILSLISCISSSFFLISLVICSISIFQCSIFLLSSFEIFFKNIFLISSSPI